MNSLDAVQRDSLKKGIPTFRPGDTVKVHVKVVEGNKTRVQVFQGVVIARRGSGAGETFTVRKVSYGVGVERTFPLHTPIVERIELVSRGDVRRAKLYYLRDLRGKAAKIREKREAYATVIDEDESSVDAIEDSVEESVDGAAESAVEVESGDEGAAVPSEEGDEPDATPSA